MKGKLGDITEARLKKAEDRLKRKFVDKVNDDIDSYNSCPEDLLTYYEHALCSHQETAYVLHWDDVAILICEQCCAIFNNSEPEPISIQGM